jgi:hypothetical protein|tara:strand:+ start:903 stop:1085 length:183 start_codon:yes stop_codon:yes gene_type:complete
MDNRDNLRVNQSTSINRTAQDFLDECEYISQDGDTVMIDEGALVECIEQYAEYVIGRAVN